MTAELRLRDLAAHVIEAERLGTLEGWRAYIWDQAKRLGAGSEEMTQAIKDERKKQ